MASTYRLDQRQAAFIQSPITSGQFADPDEVVSAALLLLEQQQSLDKLLDESLAQADAGLVIDIDTAFDEVNRMLDELAARPQ